MAGKEFLAQRRRGAEKVKGKTFWAKRREDANGQKLSVNCFCASEKELLSQRRRGAEKVKGKTFLTRRRKDAKEDHWKIFWARSSEAAKQRELKVVLRQPFGTEQVNCSRASSTRNTKSFSRFSFASSRLCGSLLKLFPAPPRLCESNSFLDTQNQFTASAFCVAHSPFKLFPAPPRLCESNSFFPEQHA
jgi:hypothetical protein